MERQLSFTDRWMFNRVMCDEEVCREVLEGTLGIEVGRIEYLNAEQAKEPTLSGKGVRMDVFARDGKRVYDIEMQLSRYRNLGKRMRFYQAALDISELGSGENYRSLPESYIIFVCQNDAYEAGLPMLIFDRTCRERPAMSADDESHWVVLNARNWERAEDNDLRDFLRYVCTGKADGTIPREIDSLVGEYNCDREWVTRVLTFEQDAQIRCDEAREEGIERGVMLGMDKLSALIGSLLAEGRTEDIARVTTDTEYRDRLLGEME